MADHNQISEKRMIAVLIDGDNAQPVFIEEILAEVSKYGRTTLRRVYGDWTTPNMNGWKLTLQANAIQPEQQFRNTAGKNATDSALIIDAMDILHSGAVDGFCIVSSDSDYTRLATRIREKGMFVMGVGKQQTPKAFTHACDVFVAVENLVQPVKKTEAKSKAGAAAVALASPMTALPLLTRAIKLCVQEDGWARSSSVGSALQKLDSSFDYRTYGCQTLAELLGKFSSSIEIRQEKNGAGSLINFVRYK